VTNSDLIVNFYCGKNIVLAEKQVFKRLESLAKDSNLFFLSRKSVKDSNPRTRVRRFDSPLAPSGSGSPKENVGICECKSHLSILIGLIVVYLNLSVKMGDVLELDTMEEIEGIEAANAAAAVGGGTGHNDEGEGEGEGEGDEEGVSQVQREADHVRCDVM
jgi:hypothetical protein